MDERGVLKLNNGNGEEEKEDAIVQRCVEVAVPASQEIVCIFW